MVVSEVEMVVSEVEMVVSEVEMVVGEILMAHGVVPEVSEYCGCGTFVFRREVSFTHTTNNTRKHRNHKLRTLLLLSILT